MFEVPTLERSSCRLMKELHVEILSTRYIYVYRWIRTFLPRDCKQITTEFRFCLSQRSTVWKVSCGGTPNDFAASRKAFIFSMHLKASDVLLIFFTEPSLMSFTSLIEKQNAISKSVFISLYLRQFFNWRRSASGFFDFFKYLQSRVPSFKIS